MSIPVIIYPVINRFELLEISLSRVDRNVEEILIINNNGDSNLNYLKGKFPSLPIRILNLPSNLGVSASWNLGFKLYPWASYWVFASADTGGTPEMWDFYKLRSGSSQLVRSSNVGFGIFSIGEDIVHKCGLFDEYFYPGYFEDTEYLQRLNAKGFGYKENLIECPFPAEELGGGKATTVHSDSQFAERNLYTHRQNRIYYEKRLTSEIPQPIGWSLARRRDCEWEKRRRIGAETLSLYEDQRVILEAPPNHCIEKIRGVYGDPSNPAKSRDVSSTLMSTLNPSGKERLEIHATNAHFGDPAPGIRKVLKCSVTYRELAREIES